MPAEAELERPACPLCGAEAARVVLEAGDDWIPEGHARGLRFTVVRCEGCGVRYTTPRYPEALKHLAFQGAYPFYERARRSIGPPTAQDMAAYQSRVDQLVQARPPGRVLDIGMGDGAFLSAMRLRGWEVSGIDIEPQVVAYAQTHLRILDCRALDVERDAFPPGPYDAVTLWGMFQLAYHPRELLGKIRPALAPGGILAIGLSNAEGAGARLFGRHWRGLGLPRHLVHHTPATLKALLEQEGYRVLATAFETPGWIVNGSLDAALPLPGLLGRVARRVARGVLSRLGRGRRGDTFTVLATVAGS